MEAGETSTFVTAVAIEEARPANSVERVKDRLGDRHSVCEDSAGKSENGDEEFILALSRSCIEISSGGMKVGVFEKKENNEG